MEFLFDTHLLLWIIEGSDKLPNKVKDILENPKNEIYYSIASMWEVAIKHGKKKLDVSGREFMHYCEEAGFRKLPIDDRHIIELETLRCLKDAPYHNDPFDRLLLAQAKADCMLFITHDKMFLGYDEPYLTLV